MKVISFIPGRLRIQVSSIYRNEDLASELCFNLHKNKSINEVKFNIYTSKLLILFNPKVIDLYKLKQLINNTINTIKDKKDIKIIELTTPRDKNNYPIKPKDHLNLNLKKSSVLIKVWIFLILSLIGYNDIYLALLLIFLLLIKKSILYIIQLFINKKITNSKGLNLKNTSKISFKNIEIQNNLLRITKKIIPISIFIALTILFISNNYLPLASILFLISFEAAYKSAPLAFLIAYNKRLQHKVIFQNFNSFKDISIIDTIIFDDLKDPNDISVKLIEDLRERGILDIYVFTRIKSPILHAMEEDVGIKVIHLSEDYYYTKVIIQNLKQDNKKIAVVCNNPSPSNTLLDTDIKILVSSKIDTLNTSFFDMIVFHENLMILGDTIDYIKYTLEKSYQNQVLSLGLNMIGIILSLSGKINYLISWLISIVANLVISINSIKASSYEPIHV